MRMKMKPADQQRCTQQYEQSDGAARQLPRLVDLLSLHILLDVDFARTFGFGPTLEHLLFHFNNNVAKHHNKVIFYHGFRA